MKKPTFSLPNWVKRFSAKAKIIAPVLACFWYLWLYAHEIWNAAAGLWV